MRETLLSNQLSRPTSLHPRDKVRSFKRASLNVAHVNEVLAVFGFGNGGVVAVEVHVMPFHVLALSPMVSCILQLATIDCQLLYPEKFEHFEETLAQMRGFVAQTAYVINLG